MSELKPKHWRRLRYHPSLHGGQGRSAEEVQASANRVALAIALAAILLTVAVVLAFGRPSSPRPPREPAAAERAER